MASASEIGGANDGDHRFSKHKVYTRKVFRGSRRHTTTTDATTSTHATATVGVVATSDVTVSADATATANMKAITDDATATTKSMVTNNDDKFALNSSTMNSVEAPAETVVTEDVHCAKQTFRESNATDINCLRLDPPEVTGGEDDASGCVRTINGLDGQTDISLVPRSREEKRELRKKLEGELYHVRNLAKRIEAREDLTKGFQNLRVVVNEGTDKRFMRTTSQVASAGTPYDMSRFSRPLNQPSLPVLENSQSRSEHLERERRTPKANQFYRNSEFLLAKDRVPPAKSNKKSKLKVKKQRGEQPGHLFGPGSKVFKNCSALLERLMKHKNGWIFSDPVDVKALGLHDYLAIIKRPMDLGTVKSFLNENRYKLPGEFAEDVRLTFRNAMTYNPRGHDVHIMAEQLWKMFEDRWAVIEADYNHEMRLVASYEMDISTPTSKLAPMDVRRMLERSDSISHPIIPKTKPVSIPPPRVAAPKKPKAKEQNKREMTYEEKQKLSVNLEGLPFEKLDQIFQIIKKRNLALCQQDGEIEVDIDSVDNETLWELDRFVTNYKKSLSKNKRKVKTTLQVTSEAGRSVQDKIPVPAQDLPKQSVSGARDDKSAQPPEALKQPDNASRSSSSSSSGSDSGSSSSDSSSESSSSDSGSDGGQSPRS